MSKQLITKKSITKAFDSSIEQKEFGNAQQ